jgi:spore coat protein U-like protein
MDYQLYTKATLTAPWVNIPNSGSVIGITTLPGGKILGIGTNNQLYTRDTLTSPWINVPNSAAVIALTHAETIF